MKTSILSKHREIDETLKRYINQRIQTVLTQLSTQVSHVVVKLGSNREVDESQSKQCDIEIAIGDNEVITVNSKRAYWLAAIDQAIEHAARAIRRALANHRKTVQSALVLPLSKKRPA